MEKKLLNRRTLVQSLSLGGLAGTLLAYQNCSNVSFNSAETTQRSSGNLNPPEPLVSPEVCRRPNNLFDIPAKPPPASVNLTQLNGKTLNYSLSLANHNPDAKFYKVSHFDNLANAEKIQYLLTVDPLNVVGGSDFLNLNFISDIYVYRQDNGELLFWKRLADKDLTPSAMFVLDPALVSSQAKLVVVVQSEMQGYFGQIVDLSQAPLDYAGAVAPFVSGADFGGSTLQRPYVSVVATGGQGNIGILHAPHFHSIVDGEVQVTLGPKTNKHGRYAENHYVSGALLFDQNGNWLSFSEESYATSSNHNFVFSGFSLQSRKVSYLRVVILDTFNGFLQGFCKVA
jgi:hypothetical protein